MTRKLITCLLALMLGLGLGMGAAYAQEGKADPAQKNEVKINKFKDGKLNLNAAGKEDLLKIDGISEKLADAILEQREENGEFVDMDELLDIEGVDNKLLRKLNKKIYLEPSSDCNC